MASNIWRRQPSGRIVGSDLLTKRIAGVSQLVADDFFEPSGAAPDVRPQDAEWNWDESVQPEFQVNSYQQSNPAAAATQPPEDAWNWDEYVEDDWSVDQTLPTVVVAAQPADIDWDWSEIVGPESITLGYQNADYIQPTPVYFDEWQWDDHADDEWYIDAQVFPPVVSIPQPVEAEFDWDEYGADEWQLESAPVVTNNNPLLTLQTDPDFDDVEDDWWVDAQVQPPVATSPQQPADADWDWDEVLSPDVLVLGYQNADNSVVPVSPVQQMDAEWDWDETLFPESVLTGYQNADNAAAPSTDQQSQTDWDFSADLAGEDGWTNHYTAYDPENTERAIDTDWDWDEVLYPESVSTGYQNADSAVVATTDMPAQTEWDFDSDFGGEDGWSNHYTAYDPADPIQPRDADWGWDEVSDDWWIDEPVPQAAIAPQPQPQAQEWDWDEYAADEIALDGSQPVGRDAEIPPVQPEWDWDERADDAEWTTEIADNPVGGNRPGAYISAYHTDLIYELALLHGLVPGNPMSVSATQRSAGDLLQSVVDAGATTTVTTVTHDILHGDVLVWIEALAAVHGLIDPLVVTPITRVAGTLAQTMANDGTTTTVETP